MFDPVFCDPPLLPCSPFHLLIEHSLGDTLHMLSLVFTARDIFLFLGRVHRANQHCPDRGSGVMQSHRAVRGE
ncbi:unnamed protein product [Staurois parvus]|uniref:Uncharacterized protein n=1 Tax=Staurois parvus TaxID=386267 RepID=A0ABN9FT27_9NEOB|nr:unnamed protein product [Staurois parvus]